MRSVTSTQQVPRAFCDPAVLGFLKIQGFLLIYEKLANYSLPLFHL